jgi:hypothetical protein
MTTALQLQNEFEDMVSDPMFGEDIIYVSGGVEYPILAKVYRKKPGADYRRFDRDTESRPASYVVELRISSKVTTGMASIAPKSDYVKIAKDIGGQIISMRVMEILDQDPGTWKLGLSV